MQSMKTLTMHSMKVQRALVRCLCTLKARPGLALQHVALLVVPNAPSPSGMPLLTALLLTAENCNAQQAVRQHVEHTAARTHQADVVERQGHEGLPKLQPPGAGPPSYSGVMTQKLCQCAGCAFTGPKPETVQHTKSAAKALKHHPLVITPY